MRLRNRAEATDNFAGEGERISARTPKDAIGTFSANHYFFKSSKANEKYISQQTSVIEDLKIVVTR